MIGRSSIFVRKDALLNVSESPRILLAYLRVGESVPVLHALQSATKGPA